MSIGINRALLIGVSFLSVAQAALAVNPAQWTIVEQLNRSDSTKTWVSPTAIDLDKMLWQYEYKITKVTGTVNVQPIGSITEDITDSIPADVRVGAGETRSLPAVLLDNTIAEPETGTSADVRVEIDSLGFGRAVFSNIMLGSVNVPFFGSRPIQRINIEASVSIVGYDFGDYNRDGLVGAADYVLWRDQRGQSGPGLAGDGNGDDRLDEVDYNLWRANFGRESGVPAASTAPVPEPATWLIVLAVLPILFRNRIQRKVVG